MSERIKIRNFQTICSALGKAIVQQQGHVTDEKSKEGQEGKEPSLVEILTEIRDDIRLMRQAMESKNQYETKDQKPQLRFKGQFENTGAMEVPATKNGE